MNRELLTVIMPLKNGLPYLIDAVNSIITQSFRDFKLIIVDDHSEDEALTFLYKLNDNRVTIINNDGNGIAEALNTALKFVQSKYVSIMDSDDISASDRFKKQIEFLESEKDVVLVGTSIKYFTDKNSNREWEVRLPNKDKEIKNGLLKGMYVLSHPSIMLRSDELKKIGGYNKKSFPLYDFDMFIRLSSRGNFANLQDCYTYVRLSDNSFTSKHLFEITKKLYLFQNKLSEDIHWYHLAKIFLKYLSAKYYKIGLKKYLDGGKITWSLFLFFAALLNLSKAFYYIRNKR